MARIAIIEDDPAIGLAMRVHLQSEGHRVDLFADGEAGMRAVLQEPSPDVIFLDMLMPHLDGFAVLQLLRERGLAARTVVVTALTHQAVSDFATQYGAAGCIGKPFNNRELTRAVARVLALE